MKHSFPPIAKPDAKILILGTMPGQKSLDLNQYYGHGGNQFWKIMFALFQEPLSYEYSTRTQLLLKRQIALWDVLDICQREGSSDNAIYDEVPNDFDNFYKAHNNISHVFFNGGNAAAFYDTYIGRTDSHIFHVLPSTSPANTWKTFERKFEEWSIIMTVLNEGK